jgi:8-hydroxy-5-deazaflavin:NADPH oxidoreductase
MAHNPAPARIGVVGAGMIGQAVAVRFSAAGDDVMLSNSRGPDTLSEVVAAVQTAAAAQRDASAQHGKVQAGTVPEAARFGDLVAVAIPPRAIPHLPPEPFAGKIVIDANNYYPEPGGRLPELDAGEITSSELLGSVLPSATVVKAFNTIYFRRLLDDSRPDLPPDGRLAIPVAADHAEAKEKVIDLIARIGFTGVDAGTLADSRRQQPGSPLYAEFAEARRRGDLLTAPRLRGLLATATP